jgi:acyl-ACP thioesterase
MGHKVEVKVTDNMCGFDRKIKPSGMLDILQSVAGEHANLLKIGYLDLKEKGYAFVLARIKYDLYEEINCYQEIIVETTPLAPGRIDFDRDFEIYDKLTNRLIGIATSKWIIIDLNTRKICRSNVFTYPCDVRDKGNYLEFDKLSFDEEELNYSYDYLIRHNDIDFIGHMNNTKYADALIYEGVCKHFEINFIHEVKLNEVLNIKYNSNKFIGYSGNVLSFKAYCTYF